MPVNPKHGAAAAVALAIAVVLGGCVPEEASPSPTATPSVAMPVLASEAEALAAAEEAYTAYLAMSDLIAQEGGRDPERIAAYVTDEQLSIDLDGYSKLLESGVVQVGTTRLVETELQQMDLRRSSGTIAIYACVDLSETQLLRPDGSELVTLRTSDLVPLVVWFDVEELVLVSLVEPSMAQASCQ